MHILLINTNPVVSRLISLCMRDEETVLEEVTNISAVKRDRYDVVFVDDASYVPEVQSLLENILLRKKVFLSSKNAVDEIVEYFDEVVKKPFLPSQITSVLENLHDEKEEVQEGETEEEKVTHFIFPLSTEDEDEEIQVEEESETELPVPSAILDNNEIERIKALLEEDEDDDVLFELNNETDYEARKIEVIKEQLESDGLEILSEEEIVDTLSKRLKEKKSKKDKNKDKKSSNKKNKVKKEKKPTEETYTFEEALIAAIEGMKPKKIKKLLKDAEVTIKISFKDKK